MEVTLHDEIHKIVTLSHLFKLINIFIVPFVSVVVYFP
jgi:hypothetical protein